MRLIPVIDLLSGQVVRGVGGRRSEYRPVQSVLTDQATPGAVAAALVETFGFRTVYVADLDAIAGAAPDWQSYVEIGSRGLRLWVDAGLGEADRGRELLRFMNEQQTLERVVSGLESSPGPESLAGLVEQFSPGRLIFSLDLKAGVPLTSAQGWRGMSPEQIAAAAWQAGVRSMIVLDLASVGMREGVNTVDLCRRLRQRWPALELIGGGGVRSIEDLQLLTDAGFDAALVASALHDGRLTVADVRDSHRRAGDG